MKQKDGGLSWAEVGDRVQTPWRKELNCDLECALTETKLHERPDYEAANRLLVKARREMAASGSK
jgi:hypothetical protein